MSDVCEVAQLVSVGKFNSGESGEINRFKRYDLPQDDLGDWSR